MEGTNILTSFNHFLWILPLFLYAETHYRFRYFFSFLQKKEPEIVADAPHRIEPGNDIPVLLLIKDAHLYPCTLLSVDVAIAQNATNVRRDSVLLKPIAIQKKWWWNVFHLKRSGLKGALELDVAITIDVNGIHQTYHNDNYKTSSRLPLRTFAAENTLPRLPRLYFGDVHTHSNYTDDQVEYGAPLHASVVLNKAMGMSFFCVTDHSYDLDDQTDDYLHNDPAVRKWQSLQKEVTRLNTRFANHKILQGEEVSCRNSRGENVHLLIIDSEDYFPGSGDSAEKWLRTRSEMSIVDVIDKIRKGLAVAAHPKEDVPFLQRLLLRRGVWKKEDLYAPGLNGIQFLNGDTLDGFQKGVEFWKTSLLAGIHLVALAGSDAHGNFNRFRQLRLPFVLLQENGHHTFGKMRTGVFLNGTLNLSTIRRSLSLGQSILTDGPVASIEVLNKQFEKVTIGGSIKGRHLTLTVNVNSSSEFGRLKTIRILGGFLGDSREATFFKSSGDSRYRFSEQISLDVSRDGYFRLDVRTDSEGTFDNNTHFCLTNPIWFFAGT